MAEEVTTTPESTQEVEANPTAELQTKLEQMEQSLSSKLAEKDSKLEEMAAKLDKMRNRVKRGKKKAKELIESQEQDQDAPDVETGEFKETDLEYEFRSFKEEVQFTRENPNYKADELKQIKLISKEKGMPLTDAKMIFEYMKNNDPSVKAQRKSKEQGLHGNFHSPSQEPDDDILTKMVLK
jgi:hypothetical protein